MKIVLLFTSIIYIFLSRIHAASVPVVEETELLLLNVIFRHGARTTYLFYPTDPNQNLTFYPTGLGGLTNEGKRDEYRLGRYIRNLYDDFLGEHYVEDEVYVRSSDVTRTRMSALLVLAGLFPPSKIQKWNEELMWQPIPVSYKEDQNEDIFHPWKYCPYKKQLLEHLPEIEKVQEIFLKPYIDTYYYINKHSGKNFTNPADLQSFFFILKSEADMNLTMPNWTQNIYPEPLETVSAEAYAYHNYDKRVKQINCGYMLKKILDDCKTKIEGKSKKKIFLYSGHESTLGYLLDALQVFKTHIPPYGSAIFIELHRGVKQFYIKIRYRNDSESLVPVDLQIPECDILCPIEQFIKLQADLIPTITVTDACKLDE